MPNRPVADWQPRVGVGADLLRETEEEERARLQREYGWDPLRRLGQLGETWQRSRGEGLAQSVLALFEPASAATKYAVGAAQGLLQSGFDKLYPAGANPTDEQRLAAGTWDLGPFSSQHKAPKIQNPLDPVEATARFEAINPVPAKFIADLAGQYLLTRGVGAALKLGQAATSGAGMVQRALPDVSKLEPLAGAPGLERAATVLSNLQSTPVQAGLRVGLPVAMATEAGLSDPDAPPEERAIKAGITGLGGLMLGHWTANAGRLGARMSRSAADALTTPPPASGLSTEADYLLQSQAASQRVAKGGALHTQDVPARVGKPLEPGPAPYPGGWGQFVWDEVRTHMTDRDAHLQTWARYAKQHGGHLPDEFYRDKRLLAGVTKQNALLVRELGDVFDGLPAEALQPGAPGRPNPANFDAYRAARMAEQRQIPDPVTGATLATGPIDDMATAQRVVQEFRTNIDATYGAGTVAKWDTMIDRFTQIENRVFQDYANAGMFSQTNTLTALQKNQIYMRLDDVNQHRESLLSGRPAGEQSAATRQAVGKAHTSGPDGVLEFGLGKDILRLTQLKELAQQNRVAQGLADAAEQDPQGLGRFMRLWAVTGDDAATGSPAPAGTQLLADRRRSAQTRGAGVDPVTGDRVLAGAADEVPAGWGRLPVYRDGVEYQYLVPKWFSQRLLGATPGEADLVSRFMAKATAPFRMAITTLSLPFILRNPFRDVATAYENTGGGFLRYAVGAGMETAAFETGLDRWFTQHANDPWVQNLPQRIQQAWQNWATGPNIRGFIESGGGGATATEMIQGLRREAQGKTTIDPAKALGLKPTLAPGVWERSGNLIGKVITSPIHALETMSEIAEETTRVAVYRAALRKGLGPEDAAMLAREGTVDFSKAGDAMRILNMWMPLLNARWQGTLRTGKAAQEDPIGFATRVGMLTVPATIATYAWNRSMFSHEYDQLSQEERDQHQILIIGSYTDPTGKITPIGPRIPMDAVSALVKVPLEHFLDTYLRTEQGRPAPVERDTVRLGPLATDYSQGRPLPPAARTEMSAGEMWLGRLASMFPVNARASTLKDPTEFAMAVAAGNPLFGVAPQLAMNRDLYRGRPIVDDDLQGLPPEYQQTASTPTVYRALANALKFLPSEAREKIGAPLQLQFLVRGLGGTAASQAGDVLELPFLAMRAAGLIPETAWRPSTPNDLQLPEGTPPEVADQYFATLARDNPKPVLIQMLGRWSGLVAMSNNQQTVAAKLKSLGPHERRIYEQTRDLNDYAARVRVNATEQMDALMRDAARNGWTQEEVRQRAHDIVVARRGALDHAAQAPQYRYAAKTLQDRQAFHAQLPGLPVDKFLETIPPLPPNTDVATLHQRYLTADGQDLTALPPMARYLARQQTLQMLARELGMPGDAVRDHLMAFVAHTSVPTLGLPNVWAEQAVNRALHPTGTNATTSPTDFRKAQRSELMALAAESGQTLEQVQEVVNNRLQRLGEQTPLGGSLGRAQGVAATINDPTRFPRYATRDGRPMLNAQGQPSTEAQWDEWDRLLEAAKSLPKGMAPASIQQLESARDWGEVKKVGGLIRDPHYADYARWYGAGRTMQVEEWDRFQNGATAKYKDLPRTPAGMQQALLRDGTIRLYQAYPDLAPEKWQLAPRVALWRQQMNRGWRAALMGE